jgi:hypothetical protein
VTRWYVHGAGVDQVVAEETTGAGGGVKWPLADHQGSVRDVVTGSGTSLDHVIYDSFGRVLSRTGTFALRYGYTGRELAEESGTGTYYYRARFYDAGIGRFLS